MSPTFETIWALARQIPRGRVATYGQLARWAGNPRLSRVVGYAMHDAPPDVPCHRVVGCSGSLTGYAGGLDKKAALLRLEDPARRAAALKLVVERGLNVAQTETYLRQLMGEESPAEKPKRTVLVRDVRIFVNTIRHAVDLMKQNGIRAESEWTETDDYLEYVVKIPRSEGERRRAARTP